MHKKKLALITGATGAIGKAITRQVLSSGNYNVIMVVKNEGKAKIVMDEIVQQAGLSTISYTVVDLSDKKQVFLFAKSVDKPVHLLINNAANTPRNRLETPDGIEVQFATNVLGYFWMMEAFTPHLKSDAPSRIINVASYWAGGLNLADLEFRRRRYNNDTAYRQSKQANRMLTVAFAKRLKEFNITVNSCHPGDVNSALSNSMGFGGDETPDQGADTPVWLATSHEVAGITGKYFERRRQQLCGFCSNHELIEKLFEVCQSYRVNPKSQAPNTK
jgi:NAD(P)-dependent dehydrogenase (short-subunit alcohol dehydrogenase family)